MNGTALIEAPSMELEQDLHPPEALTFDEAAFEAAVGRLAELDSNIPLIETLNRRAETKRYSAQDTAHQRFIQL
jgi:hypothetical protein